MNEFFVYPFTRFSNIQEKEELLFFPEGLFGMASSLSFRMRSDRKIAPYFFLEQVGGGSRFIVCDPFYFFPTYAPTLGRPDIEALEIKEGATLFLLTLVNVKRAPPRLNLEAPLLIDWGQKKGRQIIVG